MTYKKNNTHAQTIYYSKLKNILELALPTLL